MENNNDKDKPKISSDEQIFSNVAIFSLVNYMTLVLALVRGLFVAKLLGPAVYGIRSLFDVILQISDITHLGTLFAMNREVPYHRGKGDDSKCELIIASTFWSNVLSVLFIALVPIIASFYFRNGVLDDNFCDLILFSGVLIISGRLKDFYSSKLKFESEFYYLSIIDLITRFAGIVSCIVLTYYFYLRGFFIGLVISDIFFVLAAFRKGGGIPRYALSIPILKRLVQVGFPIMLAGISIAFLYNIDKIMIASMLSESELGLYGIAMLASGLIGILPDALYSVTIPPLMKKYGETNDVSQLKRYFVEPTVIIAYLLPFMLAGIYLGIHLPIEYYLTRYLPSIDVVRILAFGLFFYAISQMTISILFAIEKKRNVLFITLISVLLNAGINFIFISLGMGIVGVAIGTGLSYFFFSTVLISFMLRQYKTPLIEYFECFFLIYAPFAYSILCVYAIDCIFTSGSTGFWADLLNTAISFLLFILFYGVVFLFIRKHSAFKNLLIVIVNQFLRKTQFNR